TAHPLADPLVGARAALPLLFHRLGDVLRHTDPLLAAGLAGLAGLQAQHLFGVLDPLALVGVGPAQAADLRGDLAHLLPVGAGDGDPVALVDLDLDPFGDVVDHRVRVAESELHEGALDLGAVADADDVELLAEAGRGALHRV